MPIGRSRFGFFASSEWVEIESKPMYAKKIMAAPANTPTGLPPASVWPMMVVPKKEIPV